MLSCRASTQAVVYDDYSAECGTPKYAAFQLLAILIIALFAFGVPLGLRATPPIHTVSTSTSYLVRVMHSILDMTLDRTVTKVGSRSTMLCCICVYFRNPTTSF